MKGLLIKDFRLLKTQKNFFFLIVAVAIVMAISTKDCSFIIGYLTFIGSLFTLSTISYDEFDNGNVFLFSLPVSRKNYVAEKYGFGLIMGISSWILATILVLIEGLIRNTDMTVDILISALIILPIMLILLALMIPFHLKFGGEKGRIAIIGAVGLLFVLGILVVKMVKVFHVNLDAIFNAFPVISVGVLIGIEMAMAIVLLLFSYKVSIMIMRKKEF
ncbi:MAG: ABC-2 transporter permease [Clostridiales bacterium]|nr:ABC-2 transporter permease [Clostridiales bacterium]